MWIFAMFGTISMHIKFYSKKVIAISKLLGSVNQSICRFFYAKKGQVFRHCFFRLHKIKVWIKSTRHITLTYYVKMFIHMVYRVLCVFYFFFQLFLWPTILLWVGIYVTIAITLLFCRFKTVTFTWMCTHLCVCTSFCLCDIFFPSYIQSKVNLIMPTANII